MISNNFKISKYNYSIQYGEMVYVYNMFSRALLKLSVDSYSHIANNDFTLFDREELDVLSKYKIINSFDDETIEMIKEYTKRINDSKQCTIFLSMTSNCNLKCKYCYEDCRTSILSKTVIDESRINELVRFIEGKNVDALNIIYFGGEPTYNLDRLIYAMKTIDNLKGRIKVNHILISNGYSINQDLLNLISELESISVQITIDGTKDNHDKYRLNKNNNGTFDRIFDNLIKIHKVRPDCIVVRMNVSSEYKPYYDLIELLKEYELNDIRLSFSKIFDGQKKINCEVNESIFPLVKKADELGFKTNFSVEYGPCIGRMRQGYAIDEFLNVYKCPGMLYMDKSGYITKNGAECVEDNIVKIKKCVYTCKYGPLCFGGCVLKNSCHKKDIEDNIDYFVREKIRESEKWD